MTHPGSGNSGESPREDRSPEHRQRETCSGTDLAPRPHSHCEVLSRAVHRQFQRRFIRGEASVTFTPIVAQRVPDHARAVEQLGVALATESTGPDQVYDLDALARQVYVADLPYDATFAANRGAGSGLVVAQGQGTRERILAAAQHYRRA